jgi:hypothetical protein
MTIALDVRIQLSLINVGSQKDRISDSWKTTYAY